jgi:hypothetical protein
MTCVPLESQRKSFIADFASKIVGFSVASADRSKAGERFVVHPTTGAIELAPAYRDKAAKALMREVRRMQFRLKLRLLSLYSRQFLLELRCASLLTEGYFRRNFNDLRLLIGNGQSRERHTTN